MIICKECRKPLLEHKKWCFLKVDLGKHPDLWVEFSVAVIILALIAFWKGGII
ncbi:hypothetical protein KAR91_53730 [Candidatus Pacearchaeota archaeon]|nr:hypothetical protein [Candidatus Pacearchaeota archaeon]